MTDTDKLKRLAEDYRIGGQFITVDRRDILALIAENELIEAERSEFKAWFRRASDEINTVTEQRDEVAALLREWLMAPVIPVGLTSVYSDTKGILARIDAKGSE